MFWVFDITQVSPPNTMSRLNDDQVLQEMNKMVSWNWYQVAFIKQEALEKARETKIKADEEFHLEKGKLVRQETILIETFFAKKLKQFEVNCKIQSSHLVNRNRLTVLEHRNAMLQDLVAETKVALKQLQGPGYTELLKNLSLQVSINLDCLRDSTN